MYSIETVAVTQEEKTQRALYDKYKRGKPRKREASRDTSATSKRAMHMRRVRALMLLGGKCEICGINDMRVLEFDHIKGNGRTERAAQPQLNQVFERPQDFQILCANHHTIKHATSFEDN